MKWKFGIVSIKFPCSGLQNAFSNIATVLKALGLLVNLYWDSDLYLWGLLTLSLSAQISVIIILLGR